MTSLVPPESIKPFLDSYLPQPKPNGLPFVTLTYAQSLDSRISVAKGKQTVISHLETKSMTHYIRHFHEAILVGIGTVLADDPKLDCRYFEKASKKHPIRPIILDPDFKMRSLYNSSTMKKVNAQKPIIFIGDHVVIDEVIELAVVPLPLVNGQMRWMDILKALQGMRIKSVMVEGGAKVINDLLVYEYEGKHVVDSLIVTIGSTFLGSQGVEVSPSRGLELKDVSWWTGERDGVMAARIG
ncbi:unnamed protein product [Kuraishia capsulata CBS 1993]|uniref:2,5-diamino-6-ribosylamino-4(3H)-pyrimidinone 5'-phosphate reductase n=1 Tax=Kuraishia capsulata CBS 1993 TaxID=1382522 RepID=W6MXH7_9ASCO|nr:uncharacterized protein KUCA_T00004895001 [Kuraishia capsulata CBS 1993]CDK28910.1 unnamed protein product [Kuraishia capsulata CBS 1993]